MLPDAVTPDLALYLRGAYLVSSRSRGAHELLVRHLREHVPNLWQLTATNNRSWPWHRRFCIFGPSESIAKTHSVVFSPQPRQPAVADRTVHLRTCGLLYILTSDLISQARLLTGEEESKRGRRHSTHPPSQDRHADCRLEAANTYFLFANVYQF